MALDDTQSRELGKAFFDVGKLAFAIAVATPLVTTGGKDWGAALVGSIVVVSLFAIATKLVKEKKDKKDKEEKRP